MEALFILAGLFFLLVVPVLAIRANLKLGALEREILKLRAALAARPQAAPQVAPIAPAVAEPVPSLVEAPEPVSEPSAVPATEPASEPTPPPPAPAKPKQGLEEKLGGRIFVYIGAVMLALAGAFLVKYSIDVGLLSPAVRVFLGILLGMIVISGMLSDSCLWGLRCCWEHDEPWFVGQNARATGVLSNGWFPAVTVTISTEFEEGQRSSQTVLWIPSRGEQRFEIALTPLKRGRLRLKRMRFATQFPFGLLEKFHDQSLRVPRGEYCRCKLSLG